MPERASFLVATGQAGSRVDIILATQLPDMTRTLAQSMIEDGRVHVNGRNVKPGARLSVGDCIEVEAQPPSGSSVEPEDIPLTMVYHDTDMAVIDKPAGLVVHPAAGHPDGTIANALAYHFPSVRDFGDAMRPGIVHRLDKDTSGLMMVALSRRGLTSLQAQIASREAGREYVALASGEVRPAAGRIVAPIGRDPLNRKRMTTYGIAGRPAQTSYETIERLAGFTYVKVRLHTGRTHQIRVHFAAAGHPLAGDTLYSGAAVAGLVRQFLHAHRLRLRLPSTGEPIEFTSHLAPDLARILERLCSDTR